MYVKINILNINFDRNSFCSDLPKFKKDQLIALVINDENIKGYISLYSKDMEILKDFMDLFGFSSSWEHILNTGFSP